MRAKRKKPGTTNGFTVMEILVSLSIMSIIMVLSVAAFRNSEKTSQVDSAAQEIISALKQAQSRTLSAEGGGQWGVYFSTSTIPHRYVIYRGDDYAARNSQFDRSGDIGTYALIRTIDLGGEREVVFDRLTGEASSTGSITITHANDPNKTATVHINKAGQAATTPFTAAPGANRIEDARHVHIIYTRTVNTATEDIYLDFPGGVTETIIINDNLSEGQLDWEGDIEVAGEIQRIKIHTHRLNDPDTGFCIHRDMRYNTKSLEIEISGDSWPSPNLISFDADGSSTATGTSAFIESVEWQ